MEPGRDHPTDLGSLHGYDSTTATALSANGAVIVGSSYSDYSDTQAVAGSMAPRRPPPCALGGNHSAATAISADGTVVVGTS